MVLDQLADYWSGPLGALVQDCKEKAHKGGNRQGIRDGSRPRLELTLEPERLEYVPRHGSKQHFAVIYQSVKHRLEDIERK